MFVYLLIGHKRQVTVDISIFVNNYKLIITAFICRCFCSKSFPVSNYICCHDIHKLLEINYYFPILILDWKIIFVNLIVN